jgi:hypothetical protein
MNDTPTNSRNVPWWMVALGAFIAIVIGVGVAVVVTGGDDNDTASGDTKELVLEPLGTAGADPFTESVATEEVAVLTAVSAPTGDEGEELTVAGSQPGLYGGTQDATACDAAALVEFLDANPDKASAWAGVLGIGTDGIKDYVAGLTPVLLRTDTRVTNHGFANGVATPRQAVLQAGTAVLVDDFGVPRVRCSCGNPLTEPAPLPTQLPAATDSGQVTLVGQPWSAWNPATVVVVNANVVVNEFVVFDIETESEFTQPVGSDVETPSGGTIVVTTKGLDILATDGSVADTIPFGTPMDDVRARLKGVIGEPTEDLPIPAGNTDYCAANMVRWGELYIAYYASPTFGAWRVAAGKIDERDGSVTPHEVLGIVRDSAGVTLGMTEEELRGLRPQATTATYPARQGGGGAVPAMTVVSDWREQDASGEYVPGSTYVFLPNDFDGVWSMSLEDQC